MRASPLTVATWTAGDEPTAIKATFNKSEILRSKKQIDELFERGKPSLAHPVKMIYMTVDTQQPFPAQALFVVPKRAFKKAHDRNRLRRRMKESYRLQKHLLYEALNASNKRLALAFIYVSGKEEGFEVISEKIGKLLEKLRK
jgi:ribonuclease P protein component